MRFRFCGNLDCPDWCLAQIQELSKLSSVKLKLVVNEVLNNILSDNLKLDKLRDLMSAAKITPEGVCAIVAALRFIVESSARNHVDSQTLSSELQQLGLPREHSTSLSKAYSDRLEEVVNLLKAQSLRLNRLKCASHTIVDGLESKGLKSTDLKYGIVEITMLEQKALESTFEMCLTKDRLDHLISELQKIESQMNKILD